MILRNLSALNFRNYEEITIELPAEGALFHGVNGAGKTNLLEAISFALLGKSPRNASLRDMIRLGEREAFVRAEFESDGDERFQSIGFSKEKQIKINHNGDTNCSLKTLYGENRFIYFGPEDISLITGTPEDKRRFIDLTLSQVSAEYLDMIITYRKVLKQRNSLLTGFFDPVLCEIYEKDLASLMFRIVQEREIFFREISDEITSIYNQISDSEADIRVEYSPSISVNSEDEYFTALQERRGRDRESGFTSVGPHRDSLKCKKDGRSIVGFGSQGQCRSSALALKIASTSYLTRDNKELILAVDDAFSDLDRGRREKFYGTISDRGQLFIAVHSREELGYYPLEPFNISSGEVVRV